jgi:ubiquinone/menaquinone biosynthesis C-methylase UbiE
VKVSDLLGYTSLADVSQELKMLPRTLEPEVMDDQAEAIEYDRLDHRSVNGQFADDLLQLPDLGTRCLDLGTGTALIPIAICERNPLMRVIGFDASIPMLELGRYQIELSGMLESVQLMHGSVDSLPFDDGYFDVVLSNSLIHHLADPVACLREAYRVLKADGWLFIRDLCRPDSNVEVEGLVEAVAGTESDLGKQLLRQSLCAALTIEEMGLCLNRAGIEKGMVQRTSNRHWTLTARK